MRSFSVIGNDVCAYTGSPTCAFLVVMPCFRVSGIFVPAGTVIDGAAFSGEVAEEGSAVGPTLELSALAAVVRGVSWGSSCAESNAAPSAMIVPSKTTVRFINPPERARSSSYSQTPERGESRARTLFQHVQRIHVRGYGNLLRSKLLRLRSSRGGARQRRSVSRHYHRAYRSWLEGVHRSIGEISQSAATRAGHSAGFVVTAAQRIFHSFDLGSVNVIELITDRLIAGHVHVRQTLRNRPHLAEVLHLDADVGIHAITHQLALGVLVVVNGLHREAAHLRILRVNSIAAQKLAHLFGGLGCALIGVLQLLFLRRDIELHQRGVGVGLKLAAGAHPDGVGLGHDRAILGDERRRDCEQAKKKKRGEG